LYICGAGLARGYLNSPELTADKFIPNPFKRQNFDSERLYKTGDLVRYLPDGTIEYVGRIDEQVKIRGFRIEVGEIEAILSQQPEVQSAVVVAREDEPGNKYLVAYIGSNQPAPSLKCLRDVLRQQLPEYMVPSAFVLLDTLPLTPNGKVNRHALPQPEHHLPMAEVSGVLPQTEAERIIATVWQEILQLERVGIHDNFFNLGGHSLLLGKMQFQLQERFGQEISVIDLFKYPTIHTLANYLSLNSSEQSDSQPGRNRAETRSTRQASMKQKRQVRQQHRVKNKTEGGSQ
jgi:acyl carrier protein